MFKNALFSTRLRNHNGSVRALWRRQFIISPRTAVAQNKQNKSTTTKEFPSLQTLYWCCLATYIFSTTQIRTFRAAVTNKGRDCAYQMDVIQETKDKHTYAFKPDSRYGTNGIHVFKQDGGPTTESLMQPEGDKEKQKERGRKPICIIWSNRDVVT